MRFIGGSGSVFSYELRATSYELPVASTFLFRCEGREARVLKSSERRAVERRGAGRVGV